MSHRSGNSAKRSSPSVPESLLVVYLQNSVLPREGTAVCIACEVVLYKRNCVSRIRKHWMWIGNGLRERKSLHGYNIGLIDSSRKAIGKALALCFERNYIAMLRSAVKIDQYL